MKHWKIATKSKDYGTRGHKLFAVLSYLEDTGAVTYEQLNRFFYNYTRRCKKNKFYTGKKFNKVRDRGYIGSNLYGGYIGRYVQKTMSPHYYHINSEGIVKLNELAKKFKGLY